MSPVACAWMASIAGSVRVVESGSLQQCVWRERAPCLQAFAVVVGAQRHTNHFWAQVWPSTASVPQKLQGL